MRILWISSIAWKDSEEYRYPVNGAGAVAGSLFQQSMIEGLEQLGHCVDIISDYPYGAGSNIHKEFVWSHNGMAVDMTVRTMEVPYLSLLHKANTLRKVAVQKVRKNKYDIAIAYLIHQPYMDAVAYAKTLDPGIKTVLVCPDLPDMMDMSLARKKLKSILKKLDMRRIDKLYGKMDGFVLFAEAMSERIKLGNAKHTVIEGIASVEGLDITPVEKENFIMYAGTLHRNIGIEKIIHSLEHIDDEDLKLKIYGTGELEDYVREKATKNPRIVYGGFVDRKTLFEEEKKAIALVNARNPKDAYTRYSFPSKTFEYLYSGTPFITTKLVGVPEEYSKYLYEIDDDTPQKIAQKINQIKAMDCEIRNEQALRARAFVLEKKCAIQQAKKLTTFLSSLFEETI